MALWLSGVANAVTYTDVVTGPVYLNFRDPSLRTYTFEHDITNEGFVLGTHSIDATIKIIFDDDQSRDSREHIKVAIGSTTYGPWEINVMDTFSLVVDNTGLIDLDTDGRLTVMLQMIRGDLNFMNSELVVHASEPAAYAPEPSTLMLLGSGLAGIVSLGLKRRKR
jgi:hypothetical protein